MCNTLCARFALVCGANLSRTASPGRLKQQGCRWFELATFSYIYSLVIGVKSQINFKWFMPHNSNFANYCCELLASAGPCVAKRMFGGLGVSTDGLAIAILADLGEGEKLWLKGDDSTRSRYEAAGCKIFTYPMKGVPRTMNYFSSPEEAMDSPDAMRPWAALALDCALRARAGKNQPKVNRNTAKTAAKPARNKT